MTRSYRYLHLDVFTGRLFGGNQLAVFLDGRGLAAETMQAVAKEMNFSESTFVLPPEDAATDVRVRIFTPSEELPMAGHPTIGTAFALARAGIVEAGTAEWTFGLGIGPTPVSFVWKGDDLDFVWMTQRRPEFGPPVGDRAGAAAALGLPAGAVAASGLPVQVISCGVPFLFVPLSTRRAVDGAWLDQPAYRTWCASAGVEGVPILLFSPEPGPDRATVYSRMFAPGFGIVEDPATGGAAGALGCYLVRNKVVTPGQAGAMLNLQGVRMGRPSELHMEVSLDGDQISRVRVGGRSVVAGEGTLFI